MDNDYPQLLYHYTNYVALEGILKDGIIRLCAANNMNDSEEMIYFTRKLKKYVISKLRHEIQKKDVIDQFKKDYEIEIKKRKNEICYLFSMSQMEDDVSQWDRYGNHGKGVAIAFDSDVLSMVAKDHMLSLKKVIYGDTVISNHELIDNMIDGIQGIFPTRGNLIDLEMIFNQIFACSIHYKNPCFMSEKEYRLSSMPEWDEEYYKQLGLDISSVSTPTQINKKVILFNWKNSCDEKKIPYEKLIKKIIIGNQSGQKENVKNWLKNNDLECLLDCVKNSKATLQ